MDNELLRTIGSWIIEHQAWTDVILAGGIILQGSITILVAVYLAINDNIEWTRFFVVTLGALIIEDFTVYAVGKMFRMGRSGWKFHRKNKSNKKIQMYLFYLKKNMGKLAIVSRFIPWATMTVMFLIGWSKTKLNTFAKVYFPSLFIWFGSMTIVAYLLMSGLHYLHSTHAFRNAEISIAVVVVIFLFGGQIIRKLFGKYAAFDKKATEIGEVVEELSLEDKKDAEQKI